MWLPNKSACGFIGRLRSLCIYTENIGFRINTDKSGRRFSYDESPIRRWFTQLQAKLLAAASCSYRDFLQTRNLPFNCIHNKLYEQMSHFHSTFIYFCKLFAFLLICLLTGKVSTFPWCMESNWYQKHWNETPNFAFRKYWNSRESNKFPDNSKFHSRRSLQ